MNLSGSTQALFGTRGLTISEFIYLGVSIHPPRKILKPTYFPIVEVRITRTQKNLLIASVPLTNSSIPVMNYSTTQCVYLPQAQVNKLGRNTKTGFFRTQAEEAVRHKIMSEGHSTLLIPWPRVTHMKLKPGLCEAKNRSSVVAKSRYHYSI